MRYSLLSRFQGGLLGSFIGETLASYNPKPEATSIEQTFSAASSLGSCITEHLIHYGRLSPTDWHWIYQQQENAGFWKTTANSSELALATLPLSIFFHDNRSLLREHLEGFNAISQASSETLEDILIWGYAIALALRKEKLDASQFISHLLQDCHKFQSPLREQLEQVQAFLEQGTALEQAVYQSRQSQGNEPKCIRVRSASLRQHKPLTVGQSSQTAIALAFYCFADTPEDLRLCLLRALRTGKQAYPTAALTGALAGAYNSFSGFPLAWRLAIQKREMGQKLYQQALHLFAAWSGAYNLNHLDSVQSAAVASPLIIQLRPSLKIISQQEF